MKWSKKKKELEWKIAEQNLRNENGELVESKKIKRKNKYRDKETKKVVTLTHSFSVFSNKIFAHSHGPGDYIQNDKKKPNRARIKHSEDKDGTMYALKIQLSNAPRQNKVLSENRIAVDLGAALPGGYRKVEGVKGTWKYYSPYYYYPRGTLHQHLGYFRATMTVDAAYNLALKAAKAVHWLHTGLSSQSGKKYAHLDIKPANIVFDENDRLSFIDFGFADDIEGRAVCFRGTVGYLPIDPLRYSKQSLDIFALLRVLYLPKEMQIQDPKDEVIRTICRGTSDYSIFSDTVMRRSPQLDKLMTKAHDQDLLSRLSALDIIRELTIIRCSLDDSYKDYLESEAAMDFANRLWVQRIVIKKDYLSPHIVEQIALGAPDAIIDETILQKLVRDSQQQLVVAQPLDTIELSMPQVEEEAAAETVSGELDNVSHSKLLFFKPADVCVVQADEHIQCDATIPPESPHQLRQ